MMSNSPISKIILNLPVSDPKKRIRHKILHFIIFLLKNVRGSPVRASVNQVSGKNHRGWSLELKEGRIISSILKRSWYLNRKTGFGSLAMNSFSGLQSKSCNHLLMRFYGIRRPFEFEKIFIAKLPLLLCLKSSVREIRFETIWKISSLIQVIILKWPTNPPHEKNHPPGPDAAGDYSVVLKKQWWKQ